MLKFFAALVLLALTTVQSSTPTTTTVQLHNTGVNSNYYYSSLSGSDFGYAIGICTTVSLSPKEYMYATCSSASILTVNKYYTSDCSGTAFVTRIYSHLNTTGSESFYCNGTNAYAGINIAVYSNTCPNTAYTVYSAIDACTSVGSGVYSSVYCYGDYGEIQYYTAAGCADAAFYKKSIFNNTCMFLFNSATDVAVYGDINSCSVNPATTATATTTKKASAANHYNINQIIIFFVALFGALQL